MAATDGSVDRSSERMGAGAVLLRNGAFLPPIECRVGGPLASFRPEAAALHGLLDFTAPGEDLLVFIDSLDLLQATMRWQKGDFCPRTDERSHMDILVPLVARLRQRADVTHLVKVKSHRGLWMNSRHGADAARTPVTVLMLQRPLRPGQVFKLSRGGLPDIISLMQIYLPLLIQ